MWIHSELLETANEAGEEYIKKYRKELTQVLRSADEFSKSHEWESKIEGEAYIVSFDTLKIKPSEVELEIKTTSEVFILVFNKIIQLCT